MNSLLCKPVYSADKTVKVAAGFKLNEMSIYKLVGDRYEVFQNLKFDIAIPSNLAISGNGRVLMVTKTMLEVSA